MKCIKEISFQKCLVGITGTSLANFATVGFSKGNKEKEICRRKPTEVSEHVRTSKFLEA